tara:strand:+ start:515 stop:1033 length:519 start_codon:yes stop_codon:yes gene_type:complete
MSNLQFIKSSSTSSNVSSLSVEDCFTNQYTVYKCTYEVDEVGQELATETRLLNSSGAVTSSNYDHAYSFFVAGSGTYSDGQTSNNSKWQFTMYNEEAKGGFYVMYIYNPFDSSTFTFGNWKMSSTYLASSTRTLMARTGVGVLKVAESHTGIQVFALSSNITKAKLTVYGVQ